MAADGGTCNVVVPGCIGTRRTKFLDQAKAEREGRSVEETAAESLASTPWSATANRAERHRDMLTSVELPLTTERDLPEGAVRLQNLS
ncbi:hypothetical protein ACFZAE_10985 [Streptomyces scabiei]|uniref:hypothetical protein n=1 Tax=Streptomyces scabiei TaxID=1930 RepID=UPI0036E8C97C